MGMMVLAVIFVHMEQSNHEQTGEHRQVSLWAVLARSLPEWLSVQGYLPCTDDRTVSVHPAVSRGEGRYMQVINAQQYVYMIIEYSQRGILSWLSDIVAMILSFIPACLCIRFLHFLVVPWWRLENSSQNIGVSSWDLYWNSKDIIATMVIECFCSKYTVESCHQVTSIMKLYFLLNT